MLEAGRNALKPCRPLCDGGQLSEYRRGHSADHRPGVLDDSDHEFVVESEQPEQEVSGLQPVVAQFAGHTQSELERMRGGRGEAWLPTASRYTAVGSILQRAGPEGFAHGG